MNRHLPAPEGAATKVALEIPVDRSGKEGVTGVKHHSLGLFGGTAAAWIKGSSINESRAGCLHIPTSYSIHSSTFFHRDL
jgi:hypothetical protein